MELFLETLHLLAFMLCCDLLLVNWFRGSIVPWKRIFNDRNPSNLSQDNGVLHIYPFICILCTQCTIQYPQLINSGD